MDPRCGTVGLPHFKGTLCLQCWGGGPFLLPFSTLPSSLTLSLFSISLLSSPCHQFRLPPPFPPFHSHTQTVTAVVVGGVIIWLVKKVGKPVAEYLDDRSQVRAGISSYLQLYMEVFKFNRTACGIVSCCHLHGNHFPYPLHTRTREFWMVWMRVKTRTFDSWRSRSRLRRPLRATLRHDMRHLRS